MNLWKEKKKHKKKNEIMNLWKNELMKNKIKNESRENVYDVVPMM